MAELYKKRYELAYPSKVSSLVSLLLPWGNILASPQNHAWWKFEDDIECNFCRKEANIVHILASCQKALQSNRYRFHHNAVLRVIAHEMQVMINQAKTEVRKVCKDSIIISVKEGEQHKCRLGNIVS